MIKAKTPANWSGFCFYPVVIGDSTADAVAGAQVGKNAIENNSMAGDKARESVKQSAEYWKDQIRGKLGNGTASAIANGIINGLADTGDVALGSVDYVADTAMALATCAAGDSYCSKAMSDLSGKNQAVADSVKALMQSETWSAVADTIKQASEGNQAALEVTVGMLASIILSGNKVPHVPNVGAVGNMSEFLKQPGFGSTVKNNTQKPVNSIRGKVFIKRLIVLVVTSRKATSFIWIIYIRIILKFLISVEILRLL